ncbi:MAG TPA: MFS transporter [Candidatus Binatia bacterium]|jgi:MFS family permease
MSDSGFHRTGYRWVVLATFALLNAVLQLQWLTFAPIARDVRRVYSASAWEVDLLSLVFMAVFVVVAFPASYVIERFGLRVGVGIGAVLTATFGLMKGLAGADYSLALVAQIGLAVGQPFVLNATTKLASQWFPVYERAIAIGLATMAQFVGIVVVMIVTPMAIDGGGAAQSIHRLFIDYGVVTAIAATLVLGLLRERPASPPGPDEPRVELREGLRLIFRDRGMIQVLVFFLLGLGMFNAISTCIDQICEQKGLSVDQTGLVGGLMLIAGIAGAVVLPLLSDRKRRRRPFLILSTLGMLPGLAGLAASSNYWALLLSSFVFGFFLLGGAGPIGFQYAAEISFPAPESVSQGLILLSGQMSGILFIVAMNILGMAQSLWIFVAMGAVIAALSFAFRESPVILVAGSPVD